MYWFTEELPFMYDEGLVVTYADDTNVTWFSIYDGSDSYVEFLSTSCMETDTFPNHLYNRGTFETQDSCIAGEIEYFLPSHEDTCVLIERIVLCNNMDTAIRIHVGEAIDWDIPDGEGGNDNDCGADEGFIMVYQTGPQFTPEQFYCGGAWFFQQIEGAIVLPVKDWVWPNYGFDPSEIGGLLARHSGFYAYCDSSQDYLSFYVVEQDLTLEPEECSRYCMIKASTLNGLDDLRNLVNKGAQWSFDNEIDCYTWPPIFVTGDANGSGDIDIDDVVYLIAYIFSGGPEPVPYPVASGDATCDCTIDIDDPVYEIAYIFSGGPPPCDCWEWRDLCGEPHTAP
jgi:hypothetical protein